MKSLFTGFSTERDPTGNLVVVFQMAIGAQVIGLAMALIIVATATLYPLTGYPVVSRQIVVGASMVVVIALGIALYIWQRAQSSARITIDRARSRVLVDAHGGQKELPLHDIEKAEIGTTIRVGKRFTTVYRVEFVLRNGERVPATTGYWGYCYASPSAREKLLEVLNREFSGRSAMLS